MTRPHKPGLILVGCGKAKRVTRSRAADLYTGSLFRARRRYAEDTAQAAGAAWRILSARHDVLDPAEWIAPYDLRLDQLTPGARAAWVVRVFDQLEAFAARGLPRRIELHVGAAYARPLIEHNERWSLGWSWSWPVQGLGLGHQLAWYKRELVTAPPKKSP